MQTSRLDLNPVESMHANGEYIIYERINGTWEKAGALSFGRFYRTGKMELALSSEQKSLRLKIEKRNGGASHIDCVLLNGKPPVWANDDIYGDGSYTAGSLFPVIPVPPNIKMMAIIVMALFGMAGALTLGIGRRRPVFRPVSSILLSIFIAAGIFTGCSSGSKEEPVPERFSMAEADTSNTNYLDGKLYTLSSTLDISVSGSYTYKCMFTDWTGSNSTGAPAEERVITIK